MKLKSIQRRTSAQSGTVVGLDDAEMALSLIDLQKNSRVDYVQPVRSYDFLRELQSAASLIMDKSECEALVAEIEASSQHHRVAA